ncbi:MAG: glycosyltransferase family 9 protein [Candidatus Krumholzibacteriia bacterium]
MRDERQPKRALVIRAGQLGDTVFATAVIEPLRAALGPDLRLDWVVKRGMEALLAADPRVGRVFPITHRHLPLPLNRDKLAVVAASWREPYDVLLNLELGRQFLGLARLVRARQRFGRPFQLVADDRPAEHAVEHVRRQCALVVGAAPAAAGEPTLKVATVAAELGLRTPYLVVNPTNSQFRKQDHRSYRAWPVAHWRELLAKLAAGPDQVVLIGGRAEEAYFGLLEPLPDGVVSLAGRTSLAQLMAVLDGARALVTTDTGPAHLAAALATPVVAIFGPSDHRKTGPFATPSNTVAILRAGLPCSPCVFTGELERCPANRCMQLVTPDQVLAALARIAVQA